MIKWIVRFTGAVTLGLLHLWNLVVKFYSTIDGKSYW